MAIKVSSISIPAADYQKNTEGPKGPKGDQYPCLVCGRGCGVRSHYVHLHDGGALIVTEAEAAKLDASGDMGMYPVGRDCFRHHPELARYI